MNRRRLLVVALAVMVPAVVLAGRHLTLGLIQLVRSRRGLISTRRAEASTLSRQAVGPRTHRRDGEYLAKVGRLRVHVTTSRLPATRHFPEEFEGLALPSGAIYTTNITPDRHVLAVSSARRFTPGRTSIVLLRFGCRGWPHSLSRHGTVRILTRSSRERTSKLSMRTLEFGVTPRLGSHIRRATSCLSIVGSRVAIELLGAGRLRPKAHTRSMAKAFAGRGPGGARPRILWRGLGSLRRMSHPRGGGALSGEGSERPGTAIRFLRVVPVGGTWFAPSRRANGGPDTIGEWSEAQISQFLESGANHLRHCVWLHE